MYSVDLMMLGSVVLRIPIHVICAVITTHDSLPSKAKDRLIQYNNYREMLTSLPIIEILRAATGDIFVNFHCWYYCHQSTENNNNISYQSPVSPHCISHAQKVTAPNNSTPYITA